MVVRLDAPEDEVTDYINGEVAKGLPHVRSLIEGDRDSILVAVEGLNEEEGSRVTMEGEWTPAQVLSHLNSSLVRGLSRLQVLSSGETWENPPAFAGQGSEPDRSFEALRQEYVDGMGAIVDALAAADGSKGLELTADHPRLGPFNWMQWAVYSHHVHTSDHIAQLQEARARIEGS